MWFDVRLSPEFIHSLHCSCRTVHQVAMTAGWLVPVLIFSHSKNQKVNPCFSASWWCTCLCSRQCPIVPPFQVLIILPCLTYNHNLGIRSWEECNMYIIGYIIMQSSKEKEKTVSQNSLPFWIYTWFHLFVLFNPLLSSIIYHLQGGCWEPYP